MPDYLSDIIACIHTVSPGSFERGKTRQEVLEAHAAVRGKRRSLQWNASLEAKSVGAVDALSGVY
jgi:hypothetical protein